MFTASTDKQCKMWDLNSNQAIQVAQVKILKNTYPHLAVKLITNRLAWELVPERLAGNKMT